MQLRSRAHPNHDSLVLIASDSVDCTQLSAALGIHEYLDNSEKKLKVFYTSNKQYSIYVTTVVFRYHYQTVLYSTQNTPFGNFP